jgi:3-methyladenine DNA glycosylase AlkC
MPEPLKNMYNQKFVKDLSLSLAGAISSFPSSQFIEMIFDQGWETRELKARMRHITQCMACFLPNDYSEAIEILRKASRSSHLSPYFFELMIFPDYVEVFGLEDWDRSMLALEQFTQQSSAEFAVRPFIMQNLEKMMMQMHQWAQHPNKHVRRLASEGCRPRLPWAVSLPALKKDPKYVFQVLELLKEDASDYVRRSVANNLNDITKDNPQDVIALLQRWIVLDTKEMRWLIHHALRTLVKAGDRQALALLGYRRAKVVVEDFHIAPGKVELGDEVVFSFNLVSQLDTDQPLIVDFVISFVRSNGELNSKVFKLSNKTLHGWEKIKFHKKFSFAPISTRRYYSGIHTLGIQINGDVFARKTFEIV